MQTHPEDLETHLRVHHGLSFADGISREVLEVAHIQRHEGFGVGADHAEDDHNYETKGFT